MEENVNDAPVPSEANMKGSKEGEKKKKEEEEVVGEKHERREKINKALSTRLHMFCPERIALRNIKGKNMT